MLPLITHRSDGDECGLTADRETDLMSLEDVRNASRSSGRSGSVAE